MASPRPFPSLVEAVRVLEDGELVEDPLLVQLGDPDARVLDADQDLDARPIRPSLSDSCPDSV